MVKLSELFYHAAVICAKGRRIAAAGIFKEALMLDLNVQTDVYKEVRRAMNWLHEHMLYHPDGHVIIAMHNGGSFMPKEDQWHRINMLLMASEIARDQE